MVSSECVAPVFSEVSVVLVQPRRQNHNFLIGPKGATWMACTVFCEVYLVVHLHTKLFSVSRALAAAHVTVPLPQSRAVRFRRKSRAIFCSGRSPRIHQFTSDTDMELTNANSLVPFQTLQRVRNQLRHALRVVPPYVLAPILAR